MRGWGEVVVPKGAVAKIKDNGYKPKMDLAALRPAIPSLPKASLFNVAGHILDSKRGHKMRRLVLLIVTFIVLALPTVELFAKSQSQSSGSRASGTGSNKRHATPKGQVKKHVVTGNYDPNTGKRSKRVSKQ